MNQATETMGAAVSYASRLPDLSDGAWRPTCLRPGIDQAACDAPPWSAGPSSDSCSTSQSFDAANAAAFADDTAEMMSDLGTALNDAFILARGLDNRGVDMQALGITSAHVKALRDAAENAYTLSRIPMRADRSAK